MKNSKKIIALLLAVVTVVSTVSFSAAAAGAQESPLQPQCRVFYSRTVWSEFGHILGGFVMGKVSNVPFSFRRNAMINCIFVAQLIGLFSSPIGHQTKVVTKADESKL